MTGGVPSVLRADDAFALELSEPCAHGAGIDGGLDAAASEEQFDQTQLKTHEMQAVLARAVEAGQFDGFSTSKSVAGQAVLRRVLAQLDSAKDKLDRVRLRG